MLNAAALGLSYGEFVARILAGSRLPQPLAERQADRAALLASDDRMAELSTDLVALVTLLRQANVEQARPCRDRLEPTEAAVRQRARVLRQRIRATVQRRAPQVRVEATG